MGRESGQAVVESALILPLWLMVALGAIQLALLQQARLVTEYGAYSAVRAGVVWSGNNERMRDAALLSILPSHGAASTVEALGRTYQRLRTEDRQVHDALAPSAAAPVAFKQSGLLGLVRVKVLSPREWPGEGEELDFDAPDTYPGGEADRYRHFLSGQLDPDQEALRDATVLTVQVRYLYELRLPFANQLLFSAWEANTVAPWNRQDPIPPEEREFLRLSAAGSGPLPGRRYFIPLRARWSQRMQSNFHRKWLEVEG